MNHAPSASPSRLRLLMLGALGVVFGDIGTSPLYALQTVFSIDHGRVETNLDDIFGVMSLITWTVVLIVTVKYVWLMLRADNDGEGGILALVALLRRSLPARDTKLGGAVLVLGMVGVALFYGDSMITPAVSVLSAVEGLTLSQPGFERWSMPTALVVLTVLFLVQRFGTGRVGRVFGPVMALWFVVLAALGIPHIVAYPRILLALSPGHAFWFIVDHPVIAFVAMGAVVLTITGAEALYADMGHFGARAIRLSWLTLVLPALLINYLGQTALLVRHPQSAVSPFFSLAPGWLHLPLVVLATLATVIASQSVISGAFSASRQASQLGFLPRMTVRHTSTEESGQVYLPVVNLVLFVGVMVLLLAFKSSARLADAYGLAVTGTFVLTSILFLLLARVHFRWGWWRIALFALTVGVLELVYFAANVTKFTHGGWLPLVIAALVLVVMSTWRQGRAQLISHRQAHDPDLAEFATLLRDEPPRRVPGVAVYPHPDLLTTPLALRSGLEFNEVLHERIVLVTINFENVPHIRHVDRLKVADLGLTDVGITALQISVGYNDTPDIPRTLHEASATITDFTFTESAARYFLSEVTVDGQRLTLRHWRRALFAALHAIAADRSRYFRLPPERTMVVGTRVQL